LPRVEKSNTQISSQEVEKVVERNGQDAQVNFNQLRNLCKIFRDLKHSRLSSKEYIKFKNFI